MIGGVGGYFISNWVNVGDTYKLSDPMCPDCNNINNDNTQVENDYNIDDAKKLVYKYYKDGIIHGLNVGSDDWDLTYDMQKNFLSILTLHVTEKDWKTVACSKVAKEGEGGYEGRYMLDGYECTGKSISYEFMNKLYKELYGSSKTLPKQSGEIDIIKYEDVGAVPAYLAYNKENNIFVLGSFLGDENGPYANHYYSTIKSAKLKQGKLVISLAYIALLDYDCESNPIYQIGQEKIKPDDSRIKGLTPDQIMNKYLNQLDAFEFTFIKEGNNYILENAK